MMCTGKQEEQGECSQGIHQNLQAFQDHHHFLQHQIMQQQQHHQQQPLIFPSDHDHHHHHLNHGPPILHPTWSLPPPHFFPSPAPPRDPHDPFLPPPPPPPYAGLFAARGRAAAPLQFGYDGSAHGTEQLRILSEAIAAGSGSGHHHHHPGGSFGLQGELGKMTAQEIMDAKALAASKSHSEAERRRRERINNHLAKLRSLLPSTTKTDKASLLAEVIQHVKELKRQTSLIAETSPVPTETDELTVDDAAADDDGRFVIKASLCCEDRSDLIPDLIKTLKALRLKTLKAEITTLGGRVKNVLFITADDGGDDPCCSGGEESLQQGQHVGVDHHHNSQHQQQYCIASIQEALKAVIEKKSGENDSSSGSVKRQRTVNNINIYNP